MKEGSSEKSNDERCENIVLVGFMGTGKSSAGREISRLTGYEYIDTDEWIEQREKLSVTEIFEIKGEEYFRELESKLLEDLVGTCHKIISTGGGMILRESNQKLLKKLGFVVWLTASKDELVKRLKRSEDRPIVKNGNVEEVVNKLRKERKPYYKKVSHIKVKSTNLHVGEVAYGVVESAKIYFSKLKKD